MKLDAPSEPPAGAPLTRARVSLEPDEQVTLITGGGREYDICRKDWGYYASPSFQTRMARFGLRPALIDDGGRLLFAAVEVDREAEFAAWLGSRRLRLAAWLDEIDDDGYMNAGAGEGTT